MLVVLCYIGNNSHSFYLCTRLIVLEREKKLVVNMELVAIQHWKSLEMVKCRKIMMVQEKLVSLQD